MEKRVLAILAAITRRKRLLLGGEANTESFDPDAFDVNAFDSDAFSGLA